MAVTVIMPSPIEDRPIVLDGCATVLDAIAEIETRSPQAFGALFDREYGRTSTKPYIVTFLDGEMITDFNHRLEKNAELLFATAFSGG